MFTYTKLIIKKGKYLVGSPVGALKGNLVVT
jgi:hypothetical protein